MKRFARLVYTLLLTVPSFRGQNVGSAVCRACHADKYASQSKSGHARALVAAPPGSPGQWAFGAGEKATTWVSQRDEDTIVEHGLSYYAATKSKGLTPGHQTSDDAVYRTFDAVGTALRCFRCHSTGAINIDTKYRISPSEPGIRCEACHGPGARHVSAKGAAGTIINPRRLGAAGLNELCGACHRQASELDDDTDWSNAWNVRHQPSYLHRAACFRNSKGALSCITCHSPHEPLQKTVAAYDVKCAGCHRGVVHKTAVGPGTCVECHMPQVATSSTLTFTNHWIGIYDKGNALVPSRRAVSTLLAAAKAPPGIAIPSDPSTLAPVYAKALSQRESELGPGSPRVARAASDLGLFLKQTGKPQAAQAALAKALRIDQANGDPGVDFDRESLASVLEAEGKKDEALALYREAAGGRDAAVAARCFASLARLDSAHADTYYRSAVQAAETAFGKNDRKVAVLLHELALTLRERNDDRGAEPLLRRSLNIQERAAKADYHLTVGVMNTLGNLLEGSRRLDEAERLERVALSLSAEKFGPESAELSMTCTNLADVLWNRKNYGDAEQLYRRALAVDTALYGAERSETAADIANLGMLLKEAGQAAASDVLLRRALAIYEKTLGPDSAQARFVRGGLATR